MRKTVQFSVFFISTHTFENEKNGKQLRDFAEMTIHNHAQ